jgi:hypothetical protein
LRLQVGLPSRLEKSFAGFVFELFSNFAECIGIFELDGESQQRGYEARKQFNSIQSIKLSNPLPLLGSQQTHNIKINLKSTQSIKLSKPLPLLILLAHCSTE